MELLQLEYFRTVARLEHMTRAAEELRIAQPALSKTISRLEEDLGAPLFDRHSRQIRLNAFGKAFLPKAEAALTALEEGRREVADLAGLARGNVRIATNALNRISGALGAFRELHPDASFRIVQVAPAAIGEMTELLEKGEADLAFTAASIDRPGIREQPVLRSEIHLAVHSGHRWFGTRTDIRLEEAANEPFIEYKTGHPYRKTNEDFCRIAGIRPPIVCEVEEPSALYDLVLAGLGVAFVPGGKAHDETKARHLRIVEPVMYRDFSVAWHEDRYQSAAVRQFREFLVSRFAD
ncbi:LysR family transcriptional regulator [Cohnella zeiphila]|uniref:LysR family transcriptional regulator n=1 Tax=Cohnella zeiphila TaxID=2761120 RepID=A0A7X0SVV4_9BACL|nr:LysR family transcriptional regulator [Cohnella zeiphila]MBB6735900.1 LysR family transcriptional regulator [Cohnella zeiphila]